MEEAVRGPSPFEGAFVSPPVLAEDDPGPGRSCGPGGGDGFGDARGVEGLGAYEQDFHRGTGQFADVRNQFDLPGGYVSDAEEAVSMDSFRLESGPRFRIAYDEPRRAAAPVEGGGEPEPYRPGSEDCDLHGSPRGEGAFVTSAGEAGWGMMRWLWRPASGALSWFEGDLKWAPLKV